MVDYEWGNPSSIMLTGDEATQETNQSRQIFDHYTTQETLNVNTNTNDYFHQPAATNTTLYPHHHYHHHHQHQQQHQQPHHNNSNNNNVHSLFDPRAYASASAYAPTHHQQHHSMLSIDPVFGGAGGYFMIPKTEEVSRPADNFASRIGLNLGGRTYFSSADDDDFVNRLYRRPRPGEPGSANIPRCQAEGCNADLTHSKHYHRRHKVCEFHSKASTVITAGLTQRFCQQCSRFHLLCEFDNGKRSCRKRLADHNRRRRKYQQQPNTSQNTQNSQLEGARNSSSENLARAHSSSSVTVGVSPPRMSLDCFSQKQFQATASSLAPSTSSLFFSSG